MIQRGLKIHPVKFVDEVFAIALKHKPSKNKSTKKSTTVSNKKVYSDVARGFDEYLVQTSEIEIGYSKPKWTFHCNVFYNNLKNLIRVTQNNNLEEIGPDGQKADIYQNIGVSQIVGLSLRGKWSPNDAIFLSGNYQILADSIFRRLDNVASNKLNFVINYLAFKKLNVNIRGNWVGKIKAPEGEDAGRHARVRDGTRRGAG